MNRKRRLFLIGLLPIAILAAAVGTVRPTAAQSINVGVLTPLTGGAASYGENARKGAELALKEFTAKHRDLKIELHVEDSRGEAAVGVRAATKLTDLDGVVAIMGDVTSSVTLAVASLANERRIPLISPGASSPKITGAGEYIFRTWPSDVFEAEAMVQYIGKRGLNKLAILRINNEYGAAMETTIRAKLQAANPSVTFVAMETFEQGAREMRAQLLHIKDAAPEAIYFIGFPEAAVVFGRDYSAAGLHIPVLATSAFEDPQILRDVGSVLEGTVYTKPLSDSPRRDAFQAGYRAAYGQDSGVCSDTAYDATMLILEGVASAAAAKHTATGESIEKFLRDVHNYPGASGVLSFDKNGDVIKPIGLFVLRGGRYEELHQ